MKTRILEMKPLARQGQDMASLFHDSDAADDEDLQEDPEGRESTLQYLKGVASVAVLVASLCVGTVDCVVDWFVYAKVVQLYAPSRQQQAGVPSVHFVSAMALFCVAGTVTYALESLNSLLAFVRGRVPLQRHLLAAATLWLEDLPLTVLNTLLVTQAFMPVDAFQLAKAGVVVAGAGFRLAQPLCRHCHSRRGPTPSPLVPSPRARLYLLLLITGAVLNLVAALLFFAASLHVFRQ